MEIDVSHDIEMPIQLRQIRLNRLVSLNERKGSQREVLSPRES